jgi:undecaprenyl-diphosphatase
MASLTYPEAVVVGLLQGVTELFPVSSLGHSVLLPAVLGGRWARDLDMSADRSPYLAFVVAVERLRSRATTPAPAPVAPDGTYASATAGDRRVAAQSWRQALLIGSAQILALLPGISRSGSPIGAGLLRGLSHEDASRFAFLLATPVIAAAGVLKLPELAGPAGRGILGPVAAGSLVAGVAAYVSLRFLTRWFETRPLNPFALYCVLAGLAGVAWSLA